MKNSVGIRKSQQRIHKGVSSIMEFCIICADLSVSTILMDSSIFQHHQNFANSSNSILLTHFGVWTQKYVYVFLVMYILRLFFSLTFFLHMYVSNCEQDASMSNVKQRTYTVLHMFRQVFFKAGNQGNHQNFDQSLRSYKC